MGRVQVPMQPYDPLAPQPEIPDKLYFRIGEVARLIGVKTHVLRFWETEFPTISPKKSGTGQRLYRRKDVETLLEIKRLLYEKRFTIEGARRSLEGLPKPTPVPKSRTHKAPRQAGLFPVPAADLASIRQELLAILDLLR